MKKLSVPPELVKKHNAAYANAISMALSELCLGHALYRRNKRSKKKVLLAKWIEPASDVGLDYIKAVKGLNDRYRLLEADAETLTKAYKTLRRIRIRIERKYPSVIGKGNKRKKSHQILSYEKSLGIVNEIFNYDKFGAGEKLVVKNDAAGKIYFEWEKCNTWSAWHFLNGLNAASCAYCNADGVFALLQNHHLPGTSDMAVNHAITNRSPLDHFYSHSKYPCLGLSLHNLVPACSRCNTNFKGAKELSAKKYIHPFCDDFDDAARFVVLFNSYAGLQLVGDNDASVIVAPYSKGSLSRLEKRGQSSAEFFHLKDAYNQTYRREMMNVIRRVKMIPRSYYEILRSRYPQVEHIVLNQMFVGSTLDSSMINQERLSKLTHDIYKQLHTDELVDFVMEGL